MKWVTFLGEFGSQDYEKQIFDHWSACAQIILIRIAQERYEH